MCPVKPRVASAAPAAGSAKIIAFRPKQSSANGYGQTSRAAHRQCDPLSYYAQFPERWQAFLKAHFRSPLQVAVFFEVCPKAAEKWWEGIGGPRGDKLAYALEEIDGAAEHLFRRVA